MDFEIERTGTWHAYGKLASGVAPPGFDCQSLSSAHRPAFLWATPAAYRCRFADFLAKHFPQVAASIDDAHVGVLHLEVGALKLATRNAIWTRDWPTVRTHLSFVDSVLEAADAELHDAVGVSYLGSLLYGETSINFAKARTLLPRRLAVALEIIERHYEDLAYLQPQAH